MSAILSIITSIINSVLSFLTPILTAIFNPIMTYVIAPVWHFLGIVYNFIQATPFFNKNVFNFILVLSFFIWLLFIKFDVLEILEKKAQEIADTIKKSEDKKEDAQKYLEETKSSLANVPQEVEKIIQNAKNIAQTLDEQNKIKLAEELSNLEVRANKLKDSHLSKAKEEVSAKIANAAVSISKEYIKNSLDENSHKELIYNFINDLENMRVE